MSSRILIASVAIAATTTAAMVAYIRTWHHSLRSQITTRTVSSSERSSVCAERELESLPQDLLANPDNYRVAHFRIPLPTHLRLLTRADAEQMFTALMRRNMKLFSRRLLQSYLLRLIAKDAEQKASFQIKVIDSLEFEEGDLVCGVYRVTHRRAKKCEFGMHDPNGRFPASFGGRLVTSVVLGPDGEGEILRAETLQWVGKDEGMTLPLERESMRWMHEIASWWLLVSGAQWLGEECQRRERPR